MPLRTFSLPTRWKTLGCAKLSSGPTENLGTMEICPHLILAVTLTLLLQGLSSVQLQRRIPIAPGHGVPAAYQPVIEGLAGAEVPQRTSYTIWRQIKPNIYVFPQLDLIMIRWSCS